MKNTTLDQYMFFKRYHFSYPYESFLIEISSLFLSDPAVD